MAHATAYIDLEAIRHNLAVIRRRSGGKPIMGVVKADAYGHGAPQVARCLVGDGVDQLAVATLQEGITLRNAGVGTRILVFGAPTPADVQTYAEYDLEISIGSERALAAIRKASAPLRVHVKVDTGMTRLGFTPHAALTALRAIKEVANLTLEGVWTHFSTAHMDDHAFTPVQLKTWRTFARQLDCPVHIAASGSVFASPDVADASDSIRAGIGLYGQHVPAASVLPDVLKPAMRMVSRIVRVQYVEAGTPVSYGCTWTAPKSTRVVTVSAGYADGYPRALSNRGLVGVAGMLLPIVGKVCMDMHMLHVADPDLKVYEGDEVVLFGQGGPSCADVAEWAGTVTYEIVSGIAPRVERRYVNL